MTQISTDENSQEYLYKKDTYTVIGICMEVHRILGHGFLEIVYKDAIEFEFLKRSAFYEREKVYNIEYKGAVLPHRFYADFVVNNEIILEIKAAEGGLAEDQVAQTINYLKISGCRIGLLLNFGRARLEYRRIIFLAICVHLCNLWQTFQSISLSVIIEAE